MFPLTENPLTLDKIVQILIQTFPSLEDPSVIAQQILAWTDSQPELTICLLERVVDAISQDLGHLPIELVNDQVNAYFSSALLTSKNPRDRPLMTFLGTIAETLLEDKHHGGRLLQFYRAVLLTPHHLPSGYQGEQQVLSDLGLLHQHNRGPIKVANPIYRRIFSADWVDQQLGQPFVMQKEAWLLLTSLLSILVFILLQSVFRYVPISVTHRCNDAADLRDAILAKLSLDPAQMKQSIDYLLTLKDQGQLTEQCQEILHELQYSYGIYVAAGTYNHPLEAATTYLCQIPEAYYLERNSVPWFSRWSNIYSSTDFSGGLDTYVENNPCPGYKFLNRAKF